MQHPTNGSPSSTLRPRTRRLISVEDELYSTSGSEYASPDGSRTASPSPNARPSRLNITSAPTSSFVRSASAQASKASRETSNTLSGLWGNSWSAIQGLATNVLGTEPASKDTSTRRRKPLLDTHHRRTSTSAPPKQWGPLNSMGSQVGAGTQEERESMVRAMKRRDLLTANEHLVPDSAGRIKRRNSNERLSFSAPPGENEDRDALIYIHHVRPSDTLAGITIKFNCQQAVLRKANRMWPNDTVQSKKTIVLPVDACAVKGRPVAGPNATHEEDLLLGDWSQTPEDAAIKSPVLPNGWTSKPSENTSAPSSVSNTTDPDTPWRHDSWVLLPNDTEPTEIGRMPRRALGFFPPARRKSLAFSDATASTPRASVELGRSSTNTSTNSHASPTQQPSARRSCASSNLSNPHLHQKSTSGFLHLHGPGGVGTMNLNVRSPGPAQDPLNKLFAQHLPNVEPPPGQEYFTPWAPGLLDPDSATYSSQYGGASGAHTPLGGGDINFQEIGGAIEGWVRKVGSQAQKLLAEQGTPGGRRGGGAAGASGAVGGDLGDLIELRDDAFGIGDGEGDEREGESRGRTPSTADNLLINDQQYQSARPDTNLVLRGRGKGGTSSKDD